MKKEIVIKFEVEFPKYEDMKAAIKECKRRWNKDDFQYTSDITYTYLLTTFPGGHFRIYAGEDTNFKPTFDEMHGGYLFTDKKFELNKKAYQELINYATEKIRNSVNVW